MLKKYNIVNYFCLTILCIASINSATADIKPSFDCKKASTINEKTICSSPVLSNLDKKMANEYRKFYSHLKQDNKIAAKKIQRIWLNNRGKGCGDKSREECLKQDYYNWLSNISKGFLVSKYRELKPGRVYSSPFSETIKFRMDISENTAHDKDYGEIDQKLDLYLVDGKELHKGSHYEYGQNINTDVIDQIAFYMSRSGHIHLGLIQSIINFGGRCGAYTSQTIDFRNPIEPTSKITEVITYEADQACDTYEKELYKWAGTEDGSLTFYQLEYNSFYYQEPFVEIKVTEINSKNASSKQYYYIDKDKHSFLGTPYEKIIDNIENAVLENIHPIISKTCNFPEYSFSDYYNAKALLGKYKLGFNQIEFISNNILNAKHLIKAKVYKPVLIASLNYLDRLRTLENWESELKKAASKYPEINATANYYYDGDTNWTVNPFIEAGFYSDPNCYSKSKSPLLHASMEEWIYLFWSRRLSDETLERTERLLRIVVKLIED